MTYQYVEDRKSANIQSKHPALLLHILSSCYILYDPLKRFSVMSIQLSEDRRAFWHGAQVVMLEQVFSISSQKQSTSFDTSH